MAHRAALVFLLFTLCCIGCRAAALSIQYYTDPQCLQAASTTFNGVPNPLVAPINQCIKSFEGSSGVVYSKGVSCSPSGTATATAFTDSACTVPLPTAPSTTLAVGVCLTPPTPMPSNAGSLRVSCSTASQVSAALFSVVAAAVAICM
jgi:hypothetical protein